MWANASIAAWLPLRRWHPRLAPHHRRPVLARWWNPSHYPPIRNQSQRDAL